jgi:hypothetical protein
MAAQRVLFIIAKGPPKVRRRHAEGTPKARRRHAEGTPKASSSPPLALQVDMVPHCQPPKLLRALC